MAGLISLPRYFAAWYLVINRNITFNLWDRHDLSLKKELYLRVDRGGFGSHPVRGFNTGVFEPSGSATVMLGNCQYQSAFPGLNVKDFI
jgi:hypothetical protein